MSMTPLADPAMTRASMADNELRARQQSMNAASRKALNGETPQAKEKKLRESCEGFEAMFIQKMWEGMRASLPQEGLMHSRDEKFWQGMYDQELGKSMAAAGGIGLADMMEAQLSRNLQNASEVTANIKGRAPMAIDPVPLMAPAAAPAQPAQVVASAPADMYSGEAGLTGAVEQAEAVEPPPPSSPVQTALAEFSVTTVRTVTSGGIQQKSTTVQPMTAQAQVGQAQVGQAQVGQAGVLQNGQSQVGQPGVLQPGVLQPGVLGNNPVGQNPLGQAPTEVSAQPQRTVVRRVRNTARPSKGGISATPAGLPQSFQRTGQRAAQRMQAQPAQSTAVPSQNQAQPVQNQPVRSPVAEATPESRGADGLAVRVGQGANLTPGAELASNQAQGRLVPASGASPNTAATLYKQQMKGSASEKGAIL